MKLRRRGWRRLLVFLAVLAILPSVVVGCNSASGGSTAASGESFNAEQFFRGKTIRFVVNGSVGGPQDISGRIIAKFLGATIPGKPQVNVTNLEDLGGINRIYSSPANQLVVGASSNAQELYTSALEPGAEFDPLKMKMVGALEPAPGAVVLRSDAGYKQLSDAVGATGTPLRYPGAVNAPDAITGSEMLISWMCDKLRMPCDLVQVASDDSSQTALMLERNEVNTSIGLLSSRARSFADQLKDNTYVVAAVYGVPDGTEVNMPEGLGQPQNISSFIPPDLTEEWEKMQPVVGRGSFTDAFWMGPEVSDDVVATLRKGLVEVMGNKEALDEMAQLTKSPAKALIEGEKAQTLLQQDTDAYNANLDFYKQLQEQYWNQLWNK